MSLVNEDLFSSIDEGSAQDIETYVDESDLVSVIGKVSAGYHGFCLPLSLMSMSDLTLPIFPLSIQSPGQIQHLA